MTKQKANEEIQKGTETPSNDTINKTCFIITPLGADDSDIRRMAQGVLDAVIKPVLTELDIDIVAPHEILLPGSITKQVIKNILNSDLVIANLTGLNPNVMYEVAVRHAVRKPIVCLADNKTKLPFDIAAERTLFYENDMLGVYNLIPRLKATISAALNDDAPDNPIYNAKTDELIMKEVTGDFNKLLLDRMERIEKRLNETSISAYNTNRTSTTPRPLASKGNILIVYINSDDHSDAKVKNLVKSIMYQVQDFFQSYGQRFTGYSFNYIINDQNIIELSINIRLPTGLNIVIPENLKEQLIEANPEIVFIDSSN